MTSPTHSAGRMKLGEYLCKRLYAAGCHDVFGVPGDFNLSFLDRIVESDLRYIGCCNELNAAYAADGYSRIRGLGCCVTTYAVGELSAINGIAGSFAECVPVIKICGGPARKFYKEMPLLHHTLGDYMTPYKMYQPITVDQCVLNQPRYAARDFERVLRNCLLYKRPVYVLVPSDMPNIEIDLTEGFPPPQLLPKLNLTLVDDTAQNSAAQNSAADAAAAAENSAPAAENSAPAAENSAPAAPAAAPAAAAASAAAAAATAAPKSPILIPRYNGEHDDEELKIWSVDYIEEPLSCEAGLKEAIDEVVYRLQKSKRPVLLPGVELIRRGLQSEFYKLTTKSNIPYATMLLSKGLISECHPNFMGLYMGARSSHEIRSVISNSDCIVILGEKLTDFNTGGFTSDFSTESRILVNFDEVQISNHSYRKVFIHDFMRKFVESVPIFPNPAYDYPRAAYACPNRRDAIITNTEDSKLTMNFVFKKLAKTLPNDCILIAETGASMFSVAETMLPHGGTYIGQVFYGSIGYTIGACLGACIAVQDEIRQKYMIKGNKVSNQEAVAAASAAAAAAAAAADAAASGVKATDVKESFPAGVMDDDCSPRKPLHEPSTGCIIPRRVILSIGDGSFQVTAPDLSTIIRNKCNPIILLLNNDGYTIERVITDNIYNDIASWNYCEIPRIFGAGKNGIRAETEEEFDHAITDAINHPEEFKFIEAIIDRLDCNKLLKAAGRNMAINNMLTPSITEEMIINSRH